LKYIVLYDGWCSFCVNIVRNLKKLSNKKIQYLSFREINAKSLYNIDTQELEKKLHIINVKEKSIKNGADAFLYLCLSTPKLWILVPFIFFSIKIGVGEKLYDFIADKRNIIPSSQCNDSCKVEYNYEK
jgi:predicted DCC family thiol-disulfide oxidoreductase YuxK